MSESWYDFDSSSEAAAVRDKINKVSDSCPAGCGILGGRSVKIDHERLAREKPEILCAIKNIIEMHGGK